MPPAQTVIKSARQICQTKTKDQKARDDFVRGQLAYRHPYEKVFAIGCKTRISGRRPIDSRYAAVRDEFGPAANIERIRLQEQFFAARVSRAMLSRSCLIVFSIPIGRASPSPLRHL